MYKTIDRIMLFIKHLGISVRQFDISIGASNGYTLRMNKNRASVGSDVIENISRVHPSVNVEWLITGRGSMIRDSYSDEMNLDVLNSFSEDEIEKMVEQKVVEKEKQELKKMLREVIHEVELTNASLNK
ncbi:MAG: hypothetical protein OIF50_04405 [Flavobacteriaceae bacterium]|nr:hypothetical protein [Flavobacteriaceae bacterium]